MKRSLLLATVAAVLGGAGAVGAEVIFARRLALLFGVTAPATATVVAVYLAGMALGAHQGGKRADALGPRAGWLYVGAEAVACLWALAFLPLVGLLDGVVDRVPASASLAVCALGTAVVVGPAAVASGATFPALNRLVGRASTVRVLYAINGLGAAAGGLLAGLWLPSVLGLAGTLAAAGACSLVAGLLMLPPTLRGAPGLATTAAPPRDPLPLRTLAVTYAAIATAGMAAELGWLRLLEYTGPHPGGLCFPIVLAAYLTGLAVGGLVFEPPLRRLREGTALGVCAGVAGTAMALGIGALPLVNGAGIAGLPLWSHFADARIFDLTGLSVPLHHLLLYTGAAGITGAASGAAYPLVATSFARARAGLGRGVGLASTTGIAAGAAVGLWMGFMPAWGPGTPRTMVAVAAVCIAVGAWAARSKVLAALALLACTAWLVPPWSGLRLARDRQLVSFIETAAGPSGVSSDGTITWLHTHGEDLPGSRLPLELVMGLHPDPARTAVLALGTGVNVATALADPAVEALACVDIDPALEQLVARFPDVGPGLFDDPRARFVHADGRHFLRRSAALWDFLLSDVGTYAQYDAMGTTEFFELARSRLAPGGMFVLKVHLDSLSAAGLQAFLATFLDVFPTSGLIREDAQTSLLAGFTQVPAPEPLRLRAAQLAGLYGPDLNVRIRQAVVLGPSGLAELAEPAGEARLTDDRRMAMHRLLRRPDSTNGERPAALLADAERRHGASAADELLSAGGRFSEHHGTSGQGSDQTADQGPRGPADGAVGPPLPPTGAPPVP